MELSIRDRSRVLGEGGDFFQTDRERGDLRDFKKGAPEHGTYTSVLNVISFITTLEDTAFILGPKPRLSAPMVRDGTNMSKGKGIGFARCKHISGNDFINQEVIRSLTKNPTGFECNECFEAKGSPLCP